MEKKRKPEKLEVLEILINRSKVDDEEVVDEYVRLKKGKEGEKIVLDYMKKYGRKHWRVLPNLWLEYYGVFESDLLLLTASGIYPIEIKNYNGFYQYNDGLSKLNGRKIGGNAIYQTRKVTKNLSDLVGAKFYRVNIEGVLVFVGEDNPIEISPSIEDIHILERNQLRGFIHNICEKENHERFQPMDINQVESYLKTFQTENPFKAAPISPKEKSQLKKGILCVECAESLVTITKKYVKCSCGCVELREQAVVRTICEYGVLNFDKELTVGNLFEFFDRQASKSYLKKIFTKHFKLVNLGRYSYYVNPGLPYSQFTLNYNGY